MDITLKMLSDEHQNILKVIDALLEKCASLEAEKEIDRDFFKKTVDFVRGYADKFHHAKEEDILFKEFNVAAEKGCAHCNPVEQMLVEHNLGRNFIKELEKGLEENDKNKIISGARGYAQLLQEHIFKEDNILYPMADEALDQDTKEEMLKKFKEAEQKLIKEKEKHLSFLESLKK